MAGALGILSGNAIYFTLSALGLGAFVPASPRLLGVLRWGGIAFLVWTALRALLAKPDASGAIALAPGTRRALYLQRLTTQLTNPKTIVFFVSLLAPFIDPKASWPPAAQIAVCAATSIAVEPPILVGYGVAGAHGRRLIPGRPRRGVGGPHRRRLHARGRGLDRAAVRRPPRLRIVAMSSRTQLSTRTAFIGRA